MMHSIKRSKSTRKSGSVPSPLVTNGGAPQRPPHEVLCARYQEYKHVTKNLLGYFESLADHYSSSSKALSKLSQDIQVPLHDSALFIPHVPTAPSSPVDSKSASGPPPAGIQSLLFEIRDRTKNVATQEAQLSKSIENLVAEPLRKLRVDIKAHLASLEKEVQKRVELVNKEREGSETVLMQLNEGLGLMKTNPMILEGGSDPFVVNKLATRQVKRQVEAENDLIKTTLYWQNKSKEMEMEWVDRLKKAWLDFLTLRNDASNAIGAEYLKLQTSSQTLPNDLEWNHFSQNLPFLLKDDTPLRSLEAISYPGMDDENVLPVKSGILGRKKRFTRTWSEGYCVLTKSGYLHEWNNVGDAENGEVKPHLSLFLPACTLGMRPELGRKKNKWYIEGAKSPSGRFKGTFKLGKKELAYAFKTKSYEEAVSWWDECDKYSRLSLALKPGEAHNGTIPKAVQGLGVVGSTPEEAEGGHVDSSDEEFLDANDGTAGKRAVPPIPVTGGSGDGSGDGSGEEKHVKFGSGDGKEKEGADVKRSLSTKTSSTVPVYTSTAQEPETILESNAEGSGSGDMKVGQVHGHEKEGSSGSKFKENV